MAHGKVHAGQRRVVLTQPPSVTCASSAKPPATRFQRAAAAENQVRTLARRQPGHQRQHRQAEHQMRRDHGGHQLVGHGPGAEGALHANGHQRDDGQRGRTAQLAAVAPGHDHDGDDQHAQDGADVAMDHLDPGLGQRDRPEGHGLRGLVDVAHRAQRRGLAVAAGPVRAAQSGIGQAHEGAEHDQVQRQEPGEENQLAVASLDAIHIHVEKSGQPTREL